MQTMELYSVLEDAGQLHNEVVHIGQGQRLAIAAGGVLQRVLPLPDLCRRYLIHGGAAEVWPEPQPDPAFPGLVCNGLVIDFKLQLEAAFQLLFFGACPVSVRKFAIPGAALAVFV